MSSGPDVTVVIPTRDRWDLLASAALPSALGQQDVDVEVVVVDDGSAGASAERLRRAGTTLVRLVRHERALGVAAARNAGIAAARGAWVAFLDDDDLWSPQKLRLQLEAARAGNAVFAYGGAAAVAADRSWLYSLNPPQPARLASTLLSRNVLWGGSSNVVARADVLRNLGGFDERLFQLCDWDLWIRLSQAGAAAVCNEVVVGCIVHPRSMLLTSEDDVFEELAYLEDKHRDLSRRLGVRVDRRRFARWVALGHLRAGRRLRAARIYLVEGARSRDPGSPPRALAALLGERVAGWGRRALRRPLFDEHLAAAAEEPPWLAAYRDGASAAPVELGEAL